MKRAIGFRATLVVAVCALFTFASTALAQNIRVVLKGYDPVAYFTDGKPVKGDTGISYDWDDQRFYFSSAKHREMFAADPERYAPQFAGYCTGSMSRGVRNEGHPEGWVIADGKLFVFGVGHFGYGFDAFPHDAVTGRAGAYTAAGMIDLNPIGKRDVQNAAGQAGMTVRDLLRIDLNRHIHRKKRDGKLLCRRSRRFLINVRIRTTHTNMLTRMNIDY